MFSGKLRKAGQNNGPDLHPCGSYRYGGGIERRGLLGRRDWNRRLSNVQSIYWHQLVLCLYSLYPR
jgi:hypothetical protein